MYGDYFVVTEIDAEVENAFPSFIAALRIAGWRPENPDTQKVEVFENQVDADDDLQFRDLQAALAFADEKPDVSLRLWLSEGVDLVIQVNKTPTSIRIIIDWHASSAGKDFLTISLLESQFLLYCLAGNGFAYIASRKNIGFMEAETILDWLNSDTFSVSLPKPLRVIARASLVDVDRLREHGAANVIGNLISWRDVNCGKKQ